MKKNWGLFVAGWVLILGGSFLAHRIQTAGGVAVTDIRFPGDSGVTMSGLLYTPSGAAAAAGQQRHPAVLVSHGYINTREMQSPFAIELSQRGFVVLAMDMTGHGYSRGRVGSQGYGGPAALRYLRSLPNVDTLNIGLEGHSMGGGPILAAAVRAPNDYRAMVLEGSAPGVFGGKSTAGTATFPRNLAVVFGRYDEFANLMWREPKGSDIGGSEKARALFGVTGTVVPDSVYGSIENGSARMLHLPAITHPAEHFSVAGVAPAVDWFQRTLRSVPHARASTDQTWIWKEVGTLAAFVGFVLLLLGTFELLLHTPYLAKLNVPAIPTVEVRGPRWWLAFVVTAAVPALTFYPFMKFGELFTATRVFPQRVMNQLIVWALLNGLLTMVLSAGLRGSRPKFRMNSAKSFFLALGTIGVGYASLALVDSLFTVDFRFWVLGLKPLDATHFRIALTYVVPWTVFFMTSLRALNIYMAVKNEKAATQYWAAALAMCLGFVTLLLVQYGWLFGTGKLFSPAQALNTIIAIQFVPLLAVVCLISAFTFRRTNATAPGAFICAMLITWYIVAGTAVHV